MGETDPELVDAVLELASDDPDLPDGAKYLVLAALDGDTTLAAALDGRYEAPAREMIGTEQGPEPVGAYIRSITVAGFRGVGPECTLHLRPGPGLTIVAGRNGSGKSSFAEALEVALTGDSSRRRLSASEWAANWTNLHSGRPRMIRVELAEDDVGTTIVGVDWPTDVAAFTDQQTWIQRRGKPREHGLDVLGWARALQDCSPLLPHEELGRLLTAPPNELYNKLESILGLGRFADTQDRLNAAHKLAIEPQKQMRAELTALKKVLTASDDERAVAAHSYLSKRPPRRDALRALATGSGPAGGVMAGLTELAEVGVPDKEAFSAAVGALRSAIAAMPDGASAALDVAARRSRLLREALEFHAVHGDRPCPVCGAVDLDTSWRARAERELASDGTNRLIALRDAVTDCRSSLHRLLSGLRVPEPVPGVELATLDRARRAVTTISATPTDDESYAGHVDTHIDELVCAISALRSEAAAMAASREDAWSPLATRIGGWLHLSDQADAAAERAELLGAARTWLLKNVEMLRNQQLAPLAAQTAAIWDVLRQESNVDITAVRLPNPTKNNQRRVEIAATVDGVDAGAFSVMSTGELHAITLALFLPRATRPESPFRFVALDDPVQAMDLSKIDGLVRVLADIAAIRQVIVFSHDDRLAEAARRLVPDARTVQVRRAAQSIVTISECRDPAARDLADAQSLLDDLNVPDDVRRMVVPQLCRQAFESVARDRYYGRAFAAGHSRESVEAEWDRVRKGPRRLALALHADQHTSMLPWIRQRPWRQRALDVCGRGNHEGLTGDLQGAVADVRRLVAEIRSSV
jgi:ABC-type hemin transport system ATPase subunit